MKKILIIFLFLPLCKLTAQIAVTVADTTEDDPIETPYNPKGNYQTFGINTCALLWTLGNGGGIFFSLGADYSILKNHSIGISASVYGDENGRDAYDNHPAQSYNGANKALYLNYRYYFNFKDMRENTGLVFYLGAFGRIGMANYEWTSGYETDSIIAAKKTYYSYGGLAGFSLKFKNFEHLGLDFNAGTLFNNKTLYETYQHTPFAINTTTQYTSYDLRVTGSICWWFYRQK